jgi:tight adherence protein B
VNLSTTLVLPAVLLLLSLVGALAILRIEGHRAALRRRVIKVAGDRLRTPEGEDFRGIRLASRSKTGLVSLAIRVLRFPIDLPQAHVIPPWSACTAAAVAGVAAYLTARVYFSPVIAAAEGLVSSGLVARGIFNWEIQRYVGRLVKQLPDAIGLMSTAVSAGLPAVEGLRLVARESEQPTRSEFGRVMQEISIGVSPDAALVKLHDRTGVVEYGILSVTLGVQAKSGGRLVETMQILAETVRQRLAIIARGHALAAEAKLSAYIMVAMPIVGGTLMSVIKPGYLTPLFFDPRGQGMLVIAVALLLAGIFIMRHMIRGSLRE